MMLDLLLAEVLKILMENMELAREKIAEEIDKVCIIARWDFAVANTDKRVIW